MYILYYLAKWLTLSYCSCGIYQLKAAVFKGIESTQLQVPTAAAAGTSGDNEIHG